MPDPLRQAAERVVAEVATSWLFSSRPSDVGAVVLDAFLASPECLALAVLEACDYDVWAVDANDDRITRLVWVPRPDVAALLDGGQG